MPSTAKKKAKPAPRSRKSVDRQVKPPGLDTVLQVITDISDEIEKAEADLATLYSNRAQLYERARELGGTRPQIAQAARLSLSAVKYTRAKSA